MSWVPTSPDESGESDSDWPARRLPEQTLPRNIPERHTRVMVHSSTILSTGEEQYGLLRGRMVLENDPWGMRAMILRK